MYYNVVIKETPSFSRNELVFYFEDDLHAALDFCKRILEISLYHIEIIQVDPNDESEEVEE